jgi:hypothetical protein
MMIPLGADDVANEFKHLARVPIAEGVNQTSNVLMQRTYFMTLSPYLYMHVHAAVHINIIYRYLEIRMKSAVIVLFSHSMSLCARINNSCFKYFIAACTHTLSLRSFASSVLYKMLLFNCIAATHSSMINHAAISITRRRRRFIHVKCMHAACNNAVSES